MSALLDTLTTGRRPHSRTPVEITVRLLPAEVMPVISTWGMPVR
jgi:hypothetical protein